MDSTTDVEVEFKEEANAEVTNNVTKATVTEANLTAVGANSVSISAAASDQVGLQIASGMKAATDAAASTDAAAATSGNITSEGDGVGFEDSKDPTRSLKATAEAKFKSSVVVAQAGVEAKFIIADGPEAKLRDSATVQQSTSGMDSAAGKAVVGATAIDAEAAGDTPTASTEAKRKAET